MVLHSFSAGSDGSRPNGGLIVDGRGNLLGTVAGDGNLAVGGVIKLSLGREGWTNTVLYKATMQARDYSLTRWATFTEK